nr:hypothetical protein [Cryptosporangium arvum]
MFSARYRPSGTTPSAVRAPVPTIRSSNPAVWASSICSVIGCG